MNSIDANMEEWARIRDAYDLGETCECGAIASTIICPKHDEPVAYCAACLLGQPYHVPTVEIHRNGRIT